MSRYHHDMQITTSPFVTSSHIAAALGESVIRVRHILGTRDITPVARAGMVRMYSPDTIDRVREELAAMRKYRRNVPT